MKVCVTGGIACGKSLLASILRAEGIPVIDADDVAHEFLPDPAERRRIAREVFADPAKRRELEACLHPLIREKLDAFDGVHIIPLLFELHWEAKYDIICTVISEKAVQLDRMTRLRGYSPEEALARLAAQLPPEYKAARSQYVIRNDGSLAEFRAAAEKFVQLLKEKMQHG